MLVKNSLLAATIAIALSGTAIAHPSSERGEHEMKQMKKMHQQHERGLRGMRGLHRAFAHLDLSDEQKELLKSIKESNRETINARHASMKPLKKQMHELLSADNVDEAAVKELSIQIAESKADQMILMASIKQQSIAILTDKQREKFAEMKQKRQQQMMKHHSNG